MIWCWLRLLREILIKYKNWPRLTRHESYSNQNTILSYWSWKSIKIHSIWRVFIYFSLQWRFEVKIEKKTLVKRESHQLSLLVLPKVGSFASLLMNFYSPNIFLTPGSSFRFFFFTSPKKSGTEKFRWNKKIGWSLFNFVSVRNWTKTNETRLVCIFFKQALFDQPVVVVVVAIVVVVVSVVVYFVVFIEGISYRISCVQSWGRRQLRHRRRRRRRRRWRRQEGLHAKNLLFQTKRYRFK